MPPQQHQGQANAGASQARPQGQQGANNGPEMQALMMQFQKVAEPIVRKLKELEAVLARPPANGGFAPGTPERARLEAELNEVRQQQSKLGQQFMSAKAQLFGQQGQPQQSQQLQQQMLQQRAQQQQQQQAAAMAAAGGGGASGQATMLANQNRSVGTPPQNVRPTPGPNVRSAPDQQGPQTPGSQQALAMARSSPSMQGQQAGKVSSTSAVPSPQVQHPHVPPEAMAQRSSLISGPSNASGMAGGSGQGPFGAGIPAQLNVQPSVPEPYPNAAGPRPTLNQGLGTNPTLGTPAILQRPDPTTGALSSTTGGGVGASGMSSSGWEELLGSVAREFKGGSGASGADFDAIIADVGSAEFWDALTGKGTGADNLMNAGSVSATGAGGSGVGSGEGRLLTKRKVQELVGEIDGNERLEGDVEDVSVRVALAWMLTALTLLHSSFSRLQTSSLIPSLNFPAS